MELGITIRSVRTNAAVEKRSDTHGVERFPVAERIATSICSNMLNTKKRVKNHFERNVRREFMIELRIGKSLMEKWRREIGYQ